LRLALITVVTRCQILRLKCTKFDFGWSSAPDPAGGALRGPTSKGREGRDGRGTDGRKEGRKGRGKGREEEGKEREGEGREKGGTCSKVLGGG